MNFKTTLVLFIIMAVGIAAAVVLPKHIKPTEEAKLARDKVFPDLKTGTATALEIKKGDIHIACEKKDDIWRLTAPLADRADKAKVEAVLSACEFMQFKGTVKTGEGGINLADYGLDKPQAEVTAAGRKGKPQTLLIGKAVKGIDSSGTSTSDNDLYVKFRDDATVYRVGADILDDIDQKVADFRYRHPFELLTHRVEKIALTNESGTVVLNRSGDTWRLEQPADNADSAKLADIISAVRDAEKQDFTADDVTDFAQYGLDEPAISVEFTCKKQEGTSKLLIGDPARETDEDDDAGKVYARVDGESSVFTLKAEIVEKLSASAADLRDRTLLAVKADDVTGITIARGDSTIALQKDGPDWKMTMPQDVKADGTATRDLAKLLEETKIDEWIDEPGDLAQYGLDAPAIVDVRQKAGDDKTKDFKLLVGTKEGDLCYAKLPDSPHVVKVSGKLADEAAKGYLAFRSKRMLDFSKWDSQKLDIVRSDGIVFSAVKIKEGEWAISKPVAGRAEMSKVNNVLWALSSLDAERVVAEQTDDLKAYGLDAPAVTATVTVKGQGEDATETIHKVLIGAKADDDTWYAKVDAKKMVFTVRKSVHDDLAGNLLSLNVMKFENDDARGLKIVRGAEAFNCTRENKDAAWAVELPEGRKPNETAVAGTIDHLHLLRCEEYVEYAPEDLAKYGLDNPATVITVKVKDDQDKVLRIGKLLDNGRAYASTADASPVFILADYSVKLLNKPLSGMLLADEPAGDQAPDAAETEGAADAENAD